ncbi:unnamed protein product [Closterium sp. NIES-54]
MRGTNDAPAAAAPASAAGPLPSASAALLSSAALLAALPATPHATSTSARIDYSKWDHHDEKEEEEEEQEPRRDARNSGGGKGKAKGIDGRSYGTEPSDFGSCSPGGHSCSHQPRVNAGGRKEEDLALEKGSRKHEETSTCCAKAL